MSRTHYGVSNLDSDDMEELAAVGGDGCQTDQILYNLTRRGPEYDLIPWLAQHRVPIMAYSSVEQGRLLARPGLAAMAGDCDVTPAQIGFAWLLARDGIMPSPKAGSVAHVRDNRAALDISLLEAELHRLATLFPPPSGPEPLAMQLAGLGVFGPAPNHDAGLAVLRAAVQAGVNHIDTSDFYGPHVTNLVTREALSPYPDDLLIVSKIGARLVTMLRGCPRSSRTN